MHQTRAPTRRRSGDRITPGAAVNGSARWWLLSLGEQKSADHSGKLLRFVHFAILPSPDRRARVGGRAEALLLARRGRSSKRRRRDAYAAPRATDVSVMSAALASPDGGHSATVSVAPLSRIVQPIKMSARLGARGNHRLSRSLRHRGVPCGPLRRSESSHAVGAFVGRCSDRRRVVATRRRRRCAMSAVEAVSSFVLSCCLNPAASSACGASLTVALRVCRIPGDARA